MARPAAACSNPDPQADLRDPLAILLAEHFWGLGICQRLEALADDLGQPSAAAEAREVLDYLADDLPLHEADEEKDLFPLLRARCAGEAAAEALLAELCRSHRTDAVLVRRIGSGLKMLAAGRLPAMPLDFVFNALMLAATQRRHIEWENRVILPLAYRRLTDADLADLANAIAVRHGFAGLRVETPAQATAH